MKYYGIVYYCNRWSLLQSKGFDSVSEAEKVTKDVLSWSNDPAPYNVIHEMWLDSLGEWPTPEEQYEAKLHSANLKNQELSLENQEQ